MITVNVLGAAKWLAWVIAGICTGIVLIGSMTGRLHIDGVSQVSYSQPAPTAPTGPAPKAPQAPADTCVSAPHLTFNDCATLDPSQVQDER